jgi:hypothetical protein
MPLVAGRPVGIDGDVPELAGGARRAGVELAVEHHAAAHPGAHGDEDEIAGAPSRPHRPLGEAGEVGVVLEHHRTAEHAAEQPAGLQPLPAGQVGGGVDNPGSGVERPGNAHGQRRRGPATGRLEHRRGDRMEDGERPVGGGGGAPHRLVVGLGPGGDRRADQRAPEVDPDEGAGHLRALSAAAGRTARSGAAGSSSSIECQWALPASAFAWDGPQLPAG